MNKDQRELVELIRLLRSKLNAYRKEAWSEEEVIQFAEAHLVPLAADIEDMLNGIYPE
jgi:hypothetical protein